MKGILNYYYLNPGETTAAASCQEIKIRPEKSDLKMILWLINMNPHFYVTALDLMSKATKAKLAELGYSITSILVTRPLYNELPSFSSFGAFSKK